MVNAVPIHNENVKLESCECVHYSACTWSQKVYDLMEKGLQLNTLWDKMLCDSKNQHVWCCDDGSGEKVYPKFEDLQFLKVPEKVITSSLRQVEQPKCAQVGF